MALGAYDYVIINELIVQKNCVVSNVLDCEVNFEGCDSPPPTHTQTDTQETRLFDYDN